MRYYGKIKWFGGYNSKTGNENNYGFIERPIIGDVFVHRDQMAGLSSYLNSRRSLEGLEVTFVIETRSVNGSERQNAGQVLYLGDETDRAVLTEAFLTNDREYETLALDRLCLLLDVPEIVVLLRQKIDHQPEKSAWEPNISEKLAPILLSKQARSLRLTLDPITRLCLYQKAVTLDPYMDEVLACQLLVQNIEWQRFCISVKTEIKYGSPLFLVAPDSIKAEILRHTYQDLLEDLYRCSGRPTAVIKYSPEDVYKKLDPRDKKLAAYWAQAEGKNEFTLARMYSARGAEIAASRIYQSLGYIVTDVSKTQPVPGFAAPERTDDDDWRVFDLKLDDERCIDVKNARTPVNSKKRYVEHCVPRFKENRSKEDVVIAGVLSPYLSMKFFVDLDEIPYSCNPVLYLGETTISAIRALEKRFNYPFLKISVDGNHLIPEWSFEYPKKVYVDRDRGHQELRSYMAGQGPTKNEFKLMGVNPLPAFLACGLHLKDEMPEELNVWQIDFYQRMRPWGEKDSITMPHLFLALLVHFLERVRSDQDSSQYNPIDYRQLLYPRYSSYGENQGPLGIYDPLEIIDSLIETLATLWKNRDIVNLAGFKTFRFKGTGLLEGWRSGQDKPVTILAYCGGFVKDKGKCGFSPLIIGTNKTCTCGKLICNQCGYCSETCPECRSRMENFIPDLTVGSSFLEHDEDDSIPF